MPLTSEKQTLFDEIDKLPSNNADRHKKYDSLSQEDLLEYNEQHMNKHLWGYLRPLGSAFAQVDFLRLCPTYQVGRDPPQDAKEPWIVLNGFKINKQHCTFSWNGEENANSAVLVTTQHANAAFINRFPIEPGETRILQDGDQISFGTIDTRLEENGLEDYRFTFRHLAAGRPINPYQQDYTELKELGSGSFGTVHSALHKKSSQVRAVKTIKLRHKQKFRGLEPELTRVLDEVMVISSVNHPNICKFHEYFIEGDECVRLVLELAHEDLMHFMKRGRNVFGLADAMAQHIIYQVTHALAFLHERGIAHRDVKPENVLVSEDSWPRAKITDFGLAKVVDGITKYRTILGTPLYLAPEIGRHTAYGQNVDSWSLGMMTYGLFLPIGDPAVAAKFNEITGKVEGKVNFENLDRCLNASSIGRQFVKRLLTVDPNMRMSTNQALDHKWFKGGFTPLYGNPSQPDPPTRYRGLGLTPQDSVRSIDSVDVCAPQAGPSNYGKKLSNIQEEDDDDEDYPMDADENVPPTGDIPLSHPGRHKLNPTSTSAAQAQRRSSRCNRRGGSKTPRARKATPKTRCRSGSKTPRPRAASSSQIGLDVHNMQAQLASFTVIKGIPGHYPLTRSAAAAAALPQKGTRKSQRLRGRA